MSAQDWVIIITALISLVGALTGMAVAIVKAINEGRVERQVAAAIQIEQTNKDLVAKGIPPVTLANTVTMTNGLTKSDRAMDKATVELLTKATPPPE